MMDPYQVTVNTFNALAQSYQDKYMDLDLYNAGYDLFCELVRKRDAAVFEMGCGPGNISRYLLSKRPDFKLVGTDLAPNMVELARKNNPTAEFYVMDIRMLNTLTQRYDGLVCGFCLPYLSREDCVPLFAGCNRVLQAGGILYLSTMEDDYSKSGFQTSSDGKHQAYMYYHHENELRPLLEENGFEIVRLDRQPFHKSDTETMTDLIILARKK